MNDAWGLPNILCRGCNPRCLPVVAFLNLLAFSPFVTQLNAEQGQEWTGVWCRTLPDYYALAELTQSGQSVTGTGNGHFFGMIYDGTIRGTIAGNSLQGSWTINYLDQSDGSRFTTTAEFRFLMSPDGSSFEGLLHEHRPDGKIIAMKAIYNKERGQQQKVTPPSSGGVSGTDVIFGKPDWNSLIKNILAGVVLGAAGTGLITLAAKALRRKNNGTPKKEAQDPDRVIRYVLNPNTDVLRLSPGSPGLLEVTVWAILADGRKRVANESEIGISSDATGGLEVVPREGRGQIRCQVRAAENAIAGGQELQITATGAGLQPAEARVLVELQPPMALEFF